ncbi:hypothetical protein HG535_0B00620 [Zygotorulaspora mrakii]|uniref:Sm domain-containing protein n=1 Tax=Zygotorulaspora mrakii TaxID=42260 RepID=A0A7H9AY40_ZYGMR|nr:uncharacterized protein HG535_0B00620 [Zygotorulaspora mrakii]QLG71024.1 hypothetical protein HG535_0B00620 [Zygotorulaspora mrakii]
MSPLLKDYLNRRIIVVKTDGEAFYATLEGFDKNTNLLLFNSRNLNDEPICMAQVLRGSEIVLCGLVEDDSNLTLKLNSASNIKDTRNKVTNEYLIWEAVWKKQLKK